MTNIKNTRLKFIILLALVITLLVSVGSAYADTQYVSDVLVITLREGKGSKYKIKKTLKTGTPLEVLEESGNYLRARTKDGEEGWVLKQYITPQLPKAIVIARLKKEAGRLRTKMEKLETSLASTRNELKTAKQKHAAEAKELKKIANKNKKDAYSTSKELEQITEKYNALLEKSKNVLEIAEERDRLLATHDSLNAEVEHLQQENERLMRTGMIRWFIAGGSVFFVGWIAGKISRKQKKLYSSLS